jgi:hypothetical protein
MTDDAHLSNAEWVLKQVQIARSMERLECLGQELKYDTDQKVDYTQDAEFMKTLRAEYARSQRRLRTGGTHQT